MFAAKTTNRGKLDSHCWFFDGFAYLLQPDFCVLFDAGEQGGVAVGSATAGWQGGGRCHAGLGLTSVCVEAYTRTWVVPATCLLTGACAHTSAPAGTKPMPFALRNTYAHFKRNPWCGGLTGELRVERPYRNFLTSVQYMEWKVGGWCGEGGGDRGQRASRGPAWTWTLLGAGGHNRMRPLLSLLLHHLRWFPCSHHLTLTPARLAGVALAEQAHRVHLRLPHCAARCLLRLPLGGSGGEVAAVGWSRAASWGCVVERLLCVLAPCLHAGMVLTCALCPNALPPMHFLLPTRRASRCAATSTVSTPRTT